jgi:hydroxymethylglutaryl-CoA lyase
MRDAEEVVTALIDPASAGSLVPNPGAENRGPGNADQMRVFSLPQNPQPVNEQDDRRILGGFADVVRIAHEAKIALGADVAVAFGCPFEGDVPVEQVGRIVDRLLGLGIQEITLGDTTGMATPPLVRERCEYLLGSHPELELGLHNTRGIGLVNVYEGLRMGITCFESSVAGLGGCPFAPGATGNVCTEDLVYLLHETGIETGIDLNALINVAKKVEEVIGRPLPGQVMKAGLRLDLRPCSAEQRR